MPKRSGPVKSLFDSSIAPEDVAGESVVIRFVPLDVISKLDETLWGENPKKHDLKAIYKSIDRYGFTDPPKWDTNLNDGRGGLIYGNGRTAALVQGLTYARSVGAPPLGVFQRRSMAGTGVSL